MTSDVKNVNIRSSTKGHQIMYPLHVRGVDPWILKPSGYQLGSLTTNGLETRMTIFTDLSLTQRESLVAPRSTANEIQGISASFTVLDDIVLQEDINKYQYMKGGSPIEWVWHDDD